jgi:hypothetical protein
MGLSHQALYIATAGAYANQRKLEADIFLSQLLTQKQE